MLRKISISLFAFLVLSLAGWSENYKITSPDNRLELQLHVGEKTGFELAYDGKNLGGMEEMALHILGLPVMGVRVTVTEVKRKEGNETLHPVVAVKNSEIRNTYHELILGCKGNYQMIFRVYNDGVAYRFNTSLPDSVTVVAEKARWSFPGGTEAFYPREASFFSHNERDYIHLDVSDIQPGDMASTPALFQTPRGINVLLTESALEDYPGLWVEGNGDQTIQAVFPHYPLRVTQNNDRDVVPVERGDYLAKTAGTRYYPWRIMVVAPEDKDLLSNQLVYTLAPPQKITNTEWIRPGKVAWDWWNALNISGVNFKSGVNTATYKYFIDFAASQGIDYIILDEGWYKLGDLFDINPDVDLQEIIRYGKEKKVGIILWVVWKTLYDQMDKALDQFEAWGVKGIKVDFMQRDDQWMVNFYRKVAAAAARRHLLVDFHGAYKPSGLRREYPNVITREGVKGMEWCKWSKDITPSHDVTLPFIRMVAGPMDFTPGAMHNAQPSNFYASNTRPMSQGTRVHQLAMYVVFESPLQMLADNPTNYLREPVCLSFIAEVPVTWDRTIPLDGKVGEYVVVARKKGDSWYIGAMNNETPRDVSVDLGFLPEGKYNLRFYKDGVNADRYAEDFVSGNTGMTSGEKITLSLAAGGGWVGVLTKQK